MPWRPDKSMLKRPAYLSLVQHVSDAISQGLLGPGERLPAQRELAAEIGVSLQTVSRAYEELRRRNLVQGEVGRGTFVQARGYIEATPFRADRLADTTVDLSIYKPVAASIHKERMSRTLAQLSKDVPDDVLFSFRPNEGIPRHIASGREWLRMCGLDVDQDRVLITNGVTQGTTAALLTACKPGGTVVAEAVGHHSLAGLCSYLGLKLKGLTIDEHGIVPDAFERACAESKVEVLYLIPNLANPTVTLMPEDRRQAIVDIARANDVFIVENDVLGPLVPHKPPPLAALAKERTFYLTSFTKSIMPSLRSGYMAIPPGMLLTTRNRLLATAWMATPLMAEIASRWVTDGTAKELVMWQRKAIHERNRIAAHILGNLEFRSNPNAMHIWLSLTDQWKTDQFVAQAQKQGVAIAPSGPFVLDPDSDVRAVRVSLGSANTRNLKRGLRVLAQLLSFEPELILNSF
ncbi:PLP-dependent aminotransferase family protein [Oceanidesulfovibrio marinus]|uniref:PLP-dependent aminotransferase family protein n=1 Tax=Oceanidesulfovibrio marinus TaxID=370038 RepID=A0A6P1ZLC9_9BACT|nr:PLP-dependent aminotransferase family protein [Oceanidesulfovibrio marinus]QJT09973.1 PLP-dependent aminotransferase family protein [Oceanidesulfovibrio marinus]TVM35909.1 PLP-dependent aminotransferase family protein [Oceanidesulfovibrio marinus]